MPKAITKKLSVSGSTTTYIRRGGAVSGGDCPHCGKEFARSGDLKRHIQTHAPYEQRRWKCPMCPKRFVQKTALTTHANTHTKERPHVCDVGTCRAVFGDPSSCSRHKREAHCQHPGYDCPVRGCKSQYVLMLYTRSDVIEYFLDSIKRRSSFKKHLKEKHRLSPTEEELERMKSPEVKEENEEERHSAPDAGFTFTLQSPEVHRLNPTAGLLSNPDLITFSRSPSRTASPLMFSNDSTPDLCSPMSSGGTSLRSSPAITPMLDARERLLPYVASSDNFAGYNDLMPGAMNSFDPTKDDNTFAPEYDRQNETQTTAWDGTSPSSSVDSFFSHPLQADPYSLNIHDMSPSPGSTPLDAGDHDFAQDFAENVMGLGLEDAGFYFQISAI
ncbi:hypothetical protein BXZ70DRAFT_1009810 [Cristinia sonorae]|uniref:C2H2-type domain-containing protein n=1 Tax=Cristinia sonorae TaxID=1940300 RepID=A0A8K0XNN2_9AGAR|nr:hypothetical protein BXZ70DRAFT_1009810 [Cristinia sonorae]